MLAIFYLFIYSFILYRHIFASSGSGQGREKQLTQVIAQLFYYIHVDGQDDGATSDPFLTSIYGSFNIAKLEACADV